MKRTALELIQKSADDAKYRVGARQVTNIVSSALCAALTSEAVSLHQAEEFVASEIGQALLSLIMGCIAEAIPYHNPHFERVSYELIVEGISRGESAAFVHIMDQVKAAVEMSKAFAVPESMVTSPTASDSEEESEAENKIVGFGPPPQRK